MKLYALTTPLALLALLGTASAQLSTNNGQSACVEYGDCTTLGQNTFVTATQYAPVTPPAYTPGLATVVTTDAAYLSSLAAAGASQAYGELGGGSAQATRQQAQSAAGSTATSSLQINLGGSSTGTANAGTTANAAVGSAFNLASTLLVMGFGAVTGAVFVL